MKTSVVYARTLDRLATQTPAQRGVWTRDVQGGDWIVIRTRNSVYTLTVLSDGKYAVAGGWFERRSAESQAVGVAGCTWGGCAILTGLVAAPGMYLEFDNGVRTTRIREVKVIRGPLSNAVH
jgi:hypothetical protein